MQRVWRWLKRVNAFRIGLFSGLFFAALQVLQIAGRADVPILTKMEQALVDLQFRQRVKLNPQQTSDLIAYIFKLNKFPAGSADLEKDQAALKSIKIRK